MKTRDLPCQGEISADSAKISIPKIPNSQRVADILNAKALTPKRTTNTEKKGSLIKSFKGWR